MLILGVALIALAFVAGCSSNPGEGTPVQTTAPPVSLPQTTIAPSASITQPITTVLTKIPVTVQTPDPLGESSTLMTVKTITGVSGTQSVNVTVPNGYWEMWYTADPLVTGGQDSHSATGTNSAVFPTFSVVVRDAASGDEIETVEPPGGLDVNLWKRSGDPRPWSTKFYNGNKAFIFDITAHRVKSYTLEVRVPKV